MNLIEKIQKYVILKDVVSLNRIEKKKNNIDELFEENKESWIAALMYYGMKNNIPKIEKWIEIARKEELETFKLAIVNHYSGLINGVQGDFNEAKKYLEDSFAYVDRHRGRIMIDDINYGLDYKAMVINDLATIYLRLDDFLKARSLFERANAIFYYKTDNKNRSYTCLFNIGTIELRLHNVWQAKVHFRNVERANIEHLRVKVAINLSLAYYLLRDYKQSMDRITEMESRFEVLTEVEKMHLILIESLNKAEKIKLHRIISFKLSSVADIKLIKEELIPYFMKHNYIHYLAMALEYLKKMEVN